MKMGQVGLACLLAQSCCALSFSRQRLTLRAAAVTDANAVEERAKFDKVCLPASVFPSSSSVSSVCARVGRTRRTRAVERPGVVDLNETSSFGGKTSARRSSARLGERRVLGGEGKNFKKKRTHQKSASRT